MAYRGKFRGNFRGNFRNSEKFTEEISPENFPEISGFFSVKRNDTERKSIFLCL